jgi:hypothetical protein
MCCAPECTVFASQQDSGLNNLVAARSATREALSSLFLFALGLAHSRNPPKQGVGFLECATFMNFKTRLLLFIDFSLGS